MRHDGRHRKSRSAFAALGCAAALIAAAPACRRDEQPHVKTAAEIQADIDKVQNDPKMPPQIKEMVLGKLRGAKQTAEKKGADGT